jgi:putative transcriptional regulator
MLPPMNDSIVFSGQFLLATPGMADPRFARSVVAICSHDENGALGINIGETVEGIGFRDILRQFDLDPAEAPDCDVFLGGPMETQRGFILHSLDTNLSDTLQVGDRWGLSSSVEMLSAIAQGCGPEQWTIALGYAGWGGGQLESELTQNGWTIAEGSPDWLYETRSGDKWLMAWQALGIDPTKLSSGFGSA